MTKQSLIKERKRREIGNGVKWGKEEEGIPRQSGKKGGGDLPS